MSKKKTNILPILAVIIAGIVMLTIFLPAIFEIPGRNNNDTSLLSQEKQATETKENATKNVAKYYTSSIGGNIEIGVIFKNPLMDNNDDLVFDVVLNTHSVDLTKYKELSNFLELKTEDNMIIRDGFIWEADNEDSHHMSGVLKIKNSYDGKPIYTENTNYLNLIFKNIGDITEREHIYKDDTVNSPS
ncbi:hypothetical protein [Clostridium formicaceticum]|uniref:Uncharacterized protein n=1 Tax=Clostridium formicaceticum TaxID=1497 RepID=A0AAC9WI20_9CLOT|nr:hypothetical protein [Clostridium formicaceticum]AOY77751.1 hypothetical protein BJL90_18940 [Clostridium formicaceticum]ARE88350.1 hypothetical protein CLFO_27510 [Clostridium formicaceticum]